MRSQGGRATVESSLQTESPPVSVENPYQPVDIPVRQESGVAGADRTVFGVNAQRWHTGLALFDQMVVSGASFLTTVIVGRFCGTDGLGLFSLAMSAVILSRGMQESLISTPYTVFRLRMGDGMAAATRAGGTLAATLGFALLLSLGAVLAATVFGVFSPSTEVQTLVWMLAFTIPFTVVREFARRFDMARLNMMGAVILDVGVAAIQICVLVSLALGDALSSSLALGFIGVACAIMVAGWGVVRRREFTFEAETLGPLLKHDFAFGRWLLADQMICFAQLYGMHWLLTGMIDPSATGIFAGCASIAALAGPFLAGMGNYMSPQFAATVSSGSRHETAKLYWRMTGLLSLAVGFFALVAVVFGGELLRVIYNDSAYTGYASVVGLLALRMLFGIPALGAHHAVVAMEYPRGSMLSSLVGTLVALLLALPLIQSWGVLGAAIALISGTAIETFILLAVFRSCFHQWKWKDAT